MIVSILGWVSTILVLCGYFLNSHGKQKMAFFVWIVGDVGWITYDLFIDNFSHFTLSAIIIFLNLYGIIKSNGNEERTTSKKIPISIK